MNVRGRIYVHPDVLAVLALVMLWLLFFWRLLTPVESDQASLEKGDFSGQFVAFAGYQYARFAAGEIPLWNPYNNGGLPFIGDTQAAVFYPPRLATIGLSILSGGWSYHALELEMAAHVLACSLLMYAFVRRLTGGQRGSGFGALVAATIASYGGFMGSYPPLQLAVLEAAIWLPLGLLGILEVTRGDRLRWIWLLVTGFAYGMTWMAGHPQTAWLATCVLVAWAGYRCRNTSRGLRDFVVVSTLFGILGAGLAAVQLLPGLEYLSHTTRAGMGFDAKGNGFPFQDIVQFIFPGLASLWSPLYVGLIGLALALVAVWRRVPGALFWATVVIVALGLSFGANSPLFALFYNTLPGLRFFRGQERAAYLIAFGLAIMAGLGAVHLRSWDRLVDFKATRLIQQGLLILVIICAGVSGAIFVLWLGTPEIYSLFVGRVAFSTILAVLTIFALKWLMVNPDDLRRAGLVAGVLVLDLFTLSMDRASNYDSIPPEDQITMTPPPLVDQIRADTDLPYRVDGYRGLHDNYGSLYGVADMRGISPLFLEGTFDIQQYDLINPLAWELFAVRYVYSDWNELPVGSTIVGEGTDRYGPVKNHRLKDPRPFALLIGNIRAVGSDSEAREIMREQGFDARRTILLDRDPGIVAQPDTSPNGTSFVQNYRPELIVVEVDTPAEAVLSVSLPYYPGWEATVNGLGTEILKAYSAFSAVVVPAGKSEVRLAYDPLSFRAGALISLIEWVGMGLFLLALVIRWARNDA